MLERKSQCRWIAARKRKSRPLLRNQERTAVSVQFAVAKLLKSEVKLSVADATPFAKHVVKEAVSNFGHRL